MATINYEKVIPKELQALPIWGLFITEPQPGKDKLKKLALSPQNGKPLSTNEPAQWGSFSQALKAYQRSVRNAKGLAMLVQPPYTVIDLDHTTEDVPTDAAKDFLRLVKGTYTERSVSGEGLHAIIKGTNKTGRKRNDKAGLEVYSSLRFFAITGDVIDGAGVIRSIPDDEFNPVLEKYLEPRAPVKPTQGADSGGQSYLTDEQLIDKAMSAKNGGLFKSLFLDGWEVAGYASQSEGDVAFANMLAFWTGKDAAQIDRIFRQSALMRDKWDSKRGQSTYGADTIQNAIDTVDKVYNPSSGRKTAQYDFDDGWTDTEYGNDSESHPVSNNAETALPKGNFNAFISSKDKYYGYDDTGNAERFVDSYPNKFIYVVPENAFHYWNKKVWKLDDSRVVQRSLDEMVKALPREPIRLVLTGDPKKDQGLESKVTKAHNLYISKSRSHRGKANAIEEIKTQTVIDPSKLDANPNLINLTNGVLIVDFKNRKLGLKAFDPKYYLTKITNGGLIDDSLKTSRWKQFLNEVFLGDIEIIEFMQRAVGYSLIGLGRERKMFILYGVTAGDQNGSNGKSVFLQAISDALGDYAWKTRPEVITQSNNDSGGMNATPDIADFEGRRFVTTTEMKSGAKLDEARVKSLTSGEKQNARQIYKTARNFDTQFTLWLSTNYKPEISGTDKAIWNRLIYVPFLAYFPDSEADKDLLSKLHDEYDEIVSWVLYGAESYLESGLQIPQQIKAHGLRERKQQDVVQHFVDDCLVITSSDERLTSGEIGQVFKEWQMANGTRYSETLFFRQFKEKFIDRFKNSHGKRMYVGMAFNETLKQENEIKPSG